ncbi:MAG: DUF1801 domain-containing protein [Parvularculaceae bacterium]
MAAMKKKKATAKRPATKAATSKKADLKTKPTDASVEAFIARVANETRRRDAKTLLAMMKKLTGETPKMWGPSIVGFGSYHYKYESGHEGDMPLAGFSPRKPATVVYVLGNTPGADALFKRLGKHSMGKACLYIKSLDDVDMKVLEKIIAQSIAYVRRKYKS